MRKMPILLFFMALLVNITSVFAESAITGSAVTAVEKVNTYQQLLEESGFFEDCENFTSALKSSCTSQIMSFNGAAARAGGTVFYADTSDVASLCYTSKTPKDAAAITSAGVAAHGGSKSSAFGSDCPCPGGIEVKKDGCSLTFICKMKDDFNQSVSATIPCPQVMGTDPKYPLVKMLSGTLIEWNQTPSVSKPSSLSYGAPGGLGSTAGYGAEFYTVYFDVKLSSIDLGSKVKFTIEAANAAKNKKEALTRSNFNYYLKGDNEYVEVLTQKDIYDAYKSRSKYVQAYLALENKHYGERPWNTYEKFVKGMCNMSSDYGRCLDELLVVGHKDTEMQGDLYLGNGDMSIIGVYSEVSSHSCHGATVVNDQGQPAFAIEIESEWCFYVSATYSYWVYEMTVGSAKLGSCCDKWEWVPDCHDEEDGLGGTVEICKMKLTCKHYQSYYQIKEGWVGHGGGSSGGSSSGSCGVCSTITGYMDENGYTTTEPLAISFYQSQPLLIKPSE